MKVHETDCKKHGFLQEKDFYINLKKGKYYEKICKICVRERNNKPEIREKALIRKKARYEYLKANPIQERVCKRHGLISGKMIMTNGHCRYCREEWYEKNRDIVLEKQAKKKQEIKQNPPKSIICKVHGEIRDVALINSNGRCGICTRAYGRDYENKNRERIRVRRREWKRANAERTNKKRREKTALASRVKRFHWHSDTVKECRKHGLLKIDEVKILKNKKGEPTQKRCLQCIREIAEKVEKHRRPKRLIENRERCRKMVKKLSDPYIKTALRNSGWSREDITDQIIKLKRMSMLIKRRVKQIEGN